MASVPMKVESMTGQFFRSATNSRWPAIDHLGGKFLHPRAVQERAFPFHLDPDDLVRGTDENGGRCAHLVFLELRKYMEAAFGLSNHPAEL